MVNGPLDVTLDDLFSSDEQHRTLLDRIVRVLSAEMGTSYLDALGEVERGRDAGATTLAQALHWVKADAGYVADAIVALEKRDELANRMLEQATIRTLDDRVNEQGLVLLDQDADVRRLVMLPSERAKRFERMRALTGRYNDRDGRVRFDQDDLMALQHGGVDIVASEERRSELEAPERMLALLDAEIQKASQNRARLRMLAQGIDSWDAPQSVRDAARAEVDAKLEKAGRKPLKLLERASRDLRLLDKADGKKKRKKLAKLAKRAQVETSPSAGETQPPAAVRMLHAVPPPAHAPAGPAQSAPRSDNADIDRQVQAHMRATGTDYVTALEQIIGM